jgi:hypothetical protein
MSNMTITYPDGIALNAVLLSRESNTLRTAVLGEDDARIFILVSGTWISEDCEVVNIEFGWERHGQSNVPTEADCVCSEQFASRLISMLLAGSQGDNDVLEDMLWVFGAEGQRVRLGHGATEHR